MYKFIDNWGLEFIVFGLNLNKKSGFTLAEIMVTLGLIGAISAITIPTLAYNYRS